MANNGVPFAGDSYALREAENGTAVADVCRRLGIAEATFYGWKKRFARRGVAQRRATAPVLGAALT